MEEKVHSLLEKCQVEARQEQWQNPKSLKEELEARMVISKLHTKSLRAGHPDPVASKTLGLTDEELQVQAKNTLSSSTSFSYLTCG